MTRRFAYEGKPLTCLWCGKKIPEASEVVWIHNLTSPEEQLVLLARYRSGEKYKNLTIRRAVREVLTGRRRKEVQPGDKADYIRLFFDPPLYKSWPEKSWPENAGAEQAFFDTMKCAGLFGEFFAHQGKRLKKGE